MRLLLMITLITFFSLPSYGGEIIHYQDLGYKPPEMQEMTDQWIDTFMNHPSSSTGFMPSDEIPGYINAHTGIPHGCKSYSGEPCSSSTGDPPIGAHPDPGEGGVAN